MRFNGDICGVNQKYPLQHHIGRTVSLQKPIMLELRSFSIHEHSSWKISSLWSHELGYIFGNQEAVLRGIYDDGTEGRQIKRSRGASLVLARGHTLRGVGRVSRRSVSDVYDHDTEDARNPLMDRHRGQSPKPIVCHRDW